ncbi:hypothetical protein [Ruania alba]|uniref:DUF4439 domain-containing protein n=1 Tax=Ruania alba TaxID=648782 RepID=A0A1H5E2Q2_9MICO|nr:hypothetical protein [Ruania alba]SED85417.1 hypothetical protein SAMN04488554_0873 [Ruania alba]
MTVRTRPTRLLVGVLTTALVLLTGACSVRLDTPPAPIPSPEQSERIRQASALATAELAELARSITAEDADLTALLEDVAGDAQVQLEALGGVWEPPPRPAETDAAETPGSNADGPGTAEDVLTALTASSEAAREAIASPDVGSDLAALLAAIVLNRDGSASRLADQLGVADPVPAAEPRTPATLGASATGLCRTLDALGYAGELLAARSSGNAQDRAARTAAQMRDLAEQVAIAAGIDDSGTDPREASYAVGAGTDLEETVEAWRGDLVTGWLAQLAPADAADRAGILEHARAAARHAPEAVTAPLPGWDG